MLNKGLRNLERLRSGDRLRQAKIRAGNNTTRVLEGLQNGQAVTIDQGANAIADAQRIDSIVIFNSPGGVPVAIGPCLGPISGGIVD